MAEMDNVVAGEPVESAWGNQIRDRTLQRYADAAARDAEHPLPVEGDLAYLEAVDVVQFYDGTAWVDLATALELAALTVRVDVLDAAVVANSGGTFIYPTQGSDRVVLHSAEGSEPRIQARADRVALLYQDGSTAVVVPSDETEPITVEGYGTDAAARMVSFIGAGFGTPAAETWITQNGDLYFGQLSALGGQPWVLGYDSSTGKVGIAGVVPPAYADLTAALTDILARLEALEA